MTRRRRPPAAELLGDELAQLRTDVDDIKAEVALLRNLWALAPYARRRRVVLIPQPRPAS
jgi:hypothetical protein